jgi:predicted metal-dependent peptidase
MDKNTQLDKAKIHLMANKNSTFITTVLFYLHFKWDSAIPTAGTNGTRLRINPDFWMSLNLNEQIGLLCHETYHVVFKHMERRYDRDPERWNAAADYLINLMLDDAGFVLPEGGLLDEQYRDMSTVEIYDRLPENDGSNYQDVMMDVEGIEGTPEEQQAISDEITSIILKAATQTEMANQAGTIPADIARLIDKIRNPVLPWHSILQNYLSSFNKDDYSWRRPNRRFEDIYLPSLYSEGLTSVAIAIDTSGSVSEADFNAFLSEVKGIHEMLHPKTMYIIDFDTTIKNIYTLTNDDTILNLNFNGWGGTDLTPVFEHFEKNHPDLLLVFSDLECTPIEKSPPYPVIWICNDNPDAKVNFGKLIHFTTRE